MYFLIGKLQYFSKSAKIYYKIKSNCVRGNANIYFRDFCAFLLSFLWGKESHAFKFSRINQMYTRSPESGFWKLICLSVGLFVIKISEERIIVSSWKLKFSCYMEHARKHHLLVIIAYREVWKAAEKQW